MNFEMGWQLNFSTAHSREENKKTLSLNVDVKMKKKNLCNMFNKKEKAGILDVVFFTLKVKPINQTHRLFHYNDNKPGLDKQTFPQ